MNELVIFDLDNTVVCGQSQQLFLKYLWMTKKIGFFTYFNIFVLFVAYRIGFIKNPQKAMTRAFSFLKGVSEEEINKLVNKFFVSVLQYRIYPDAIRLIRQYQQRGQPIILVSNAADFIVQSAANYFNIPVYFSTTLERKEKVFTGKILIHMYGSNKAKTIKKYAQENSFDLTKATAYGDHLSDTFLFREIGYPIAVNPDTELKHIATTEGWKIIHFTL